MKSLFKVGSVAPPRPKETPGELAVYLRALHRFMDHPTPETWKAAMLANVDLWDWLQVNRAWGSSGPHLHFPPPRRRLRWPARWRR